MFNTDTRFIVLDTETTNSLDDPLCYDIGFAVVDIFGNVYEQYSFVVADIFLDKNLMESAYFSEKIPQYWEEIHEGKRILTSFFKIKSAFYKCIYRNKVKIILAHNAKFDYHSLNLTQRYITSSKHRFFFPYRIEIWDTLKMSRAILKDINEYNDFCHTNNYLTARKCKQFTAEVIYRFISGDSAFEEKHTGLEDVLIEKEIFAYCIAKDPDINGRLPLN